MYGFIVAGIDGSSSAVQAAVWAGTEARRRGRPLRLVQVYTLPNVRSPIAFGSLDQVREGLAERAEEWLADARAAVLAEHPGLEITTAAREWSPVTALIQESQHAELVVLGSRGLGGFTGLLVGSTAVSVVAHAHCPIVVVRGRTPHSPPPVTGPVLVGADGSPDSEAALAFACEEAQLRGTGLTVVHAWTEILTDDVPRLYPLHVDAAAIERTERAKLTEQMAALAGKVPGHPDRVRRHPRAAGTHAAGARGGRSAHRGRLPRSRWVHRHADGLDEPGAHRALAVPGGRRATPAGRDRVVSTCGSDRRRSR